MTTPEAARGFVLWSDARAVALCKPAGVSLQTPRAQPGAAVLRLLAMLTAADRRRHALDGDGTLHLVHRLDVGTSGVVLLARDADAHRALAQAFATREAHKTYLALVWGRPAPRAGVLDAPLGPDRKDRRRMKVDAAGRPARSDYVVLAVATHCTLVQLVPHTGRTHQLRVHLASAGHPIVGDDLYGGPRHHGVREPELRRVLQPPHPLLHAWRLRVPATAATAAIDALAPLPETFASTLDALGVPVPLEPAG